MSIVATPVATPAAGTYEGSQSVVLTSATAGTSIYYTRDGSEPTLTSALGIKPTNLGTRVTSNTGLLVKSESLMFVTGLGQAIVKSVDRGSTWSYVAGATASWYRDGFVTRDGSLIYGFSGGQLKISHDDAVTWEVLTGSPSRDAGSFWRDVDDGSIRHGGQGSASIYKSLDEGLTWSIVPGANAGRQCCQAHDGTLYEGRRGFPIYKSTDKGVTWAPIAGSPTKNWVQGSTVSSDGSIWQIAEDEYLYKSSDNGVTWVAQTQYGARSWYAGDTSPNGTTYFTTWSGDTFLEIGYVALGSSTLYTAPLAITTSTTVKAVAVKAGLDDSAILTADYLINPTGTFPILTPCTLQMLCDSKVANSSSGRRRAVSRDSSFVFSAALNLPSECEQFESVPYYNFPVIGDCEIRQLDLAKYTFRDTEKTSSVKCMIVPNIMLKRTGDFRISCEPNISVDEAMLVATGSSSLEVLSSSRALSLKCVWTVSFLAATQFIEWLRGSVNRIFTTSVAGMKGVACQIGDSVSLEIGSTDVKISADLAIVNTKQFPLNVTASRVGNVVTVSAGVGYTGTLVNRLGEIVEVVTTLTNILTFATYPENCYLLIRQGNNVTEWFEL